MIVINDVTWNDIRDSLPPMKPGEMSDPVLVITGEFDQGHTVTLARCWLSSMPGSEPKWYLDELRCIADVVIGWNEIK